jgi:hypothetical protein
VALPIAGRAIQRDWHLIAKLDPWRSHNGASTMTSVSPCLVASLLFGCHDRWSGDDIGRM